MNSFHSRARAGAADQYGRANVDKFLRRARIAIAIRWCLIAAALVMLAFTAGVHWQ